MTRPKASRYPVTSFGPELMAILLKGAREKVSIPCPDQRFMKHLQMRLQMLRGAMAREKHPQYNLVTRARTTRKWNTALGKDVDCVLVVQPNDAQFTDALRAAGVTVTPNDEDLLRHPEALSSPSLDPAVEDEPLTDPYARFKGV